MLPRTSPTLSANWHGAKRSPRSSRMRPKRLWISCRSDYYYSPLPSATADATYSLSLSSLFPGSLLCRGRNISNAPPNPFPGSFRGRWPMPSPATLTTPLLSSFSPRGTGHLVHQRNGSGRPDRLFGPCNLSLGSPELSYRAKDNQRTARGCRSSATDSSSHQCPCTAMPTRHASNVASSPDQ